MHKSAKEHVAEKRRKEEEEAALAREQAAANAAAADAVSTETGEETTQGKEP